MESKELRFRFPLDITFFGEEGDEDPKKDNPDNIDPNEVKDPAKEEGEGGEDKKDDKPTKQSQSENAKYAQMRREAEAKAKAEKEERERELQRAKEEGIREGKRTALKTNPYTEEAIEDDYDLEVYELQKELDEKGKDPIKDLPRELARRRREKEKAEREKSEAEKKSKQEQEAKLNELKASMRKEIADVQKKYELSDEEMKNLITGDSDFAKKVKEKQGRWTLEEIFEAYYKPKKKDEEKRNTPNPTPAGTKTVKSIKDMNDDEFVTHMKEKYGGF